VLRRTHIEPFLRERDGAIEVEFLEDPDGRVAAFLDRLCRLVGRLENRPRAAVLEVLRRQEPRVRDARRLAGIAKSLLDRCDFAPAPGAERAPEIRDAVFRARGARWPPTPGDRGTPYEEAAAGLGLAVADVERLLYADRPDARLLVRGPRFGGATLLCLYNLDLARGVLLDASRVVVTARGGWRDLFRAVKLARLMYRIERAGARAYRVELTGPAAPHVARRERYGVRLARVVPALVREPGWRLEAEVLRGDRTLAYRLDGRAPIAAPRRRTAYDSAWERSLAEEFAEKMGEERGGWSLLREATPVAAGDELLLPDFTLRHADGREALVEIVGFWAPEYLEAKLRKVAAAGLDNLVLVVYEGLAAGPAGSNLAGPGTAAVVCFKQRPRIGPVLEAAERAARPPAV
jgi:predicted nuclease of restriction endonuclease-like RecB superfamily